MASSARARRHACCARQHARISFASVGGRLGIRCRQLSGGSGTARTIRRRTSIVSSSTSARPGSFKRNRRCVLGAFATGAFMPWEFFPQADLPSLTSPCLSSVHSVLRPPLHVTVAPRALRARHMARPSHRFAAQSSRTRAWTAGGSSGREGTAQRGPKTAKTPRETQQ